MILGADVEQRGAQGRVSDGGQAIHHLDVLSVFRTPRERASRGGARAGLPSVRWMGTARPGTAPANSCQRYDSRAPAMGDSPQLHVRLTRGRLAWAAGSNWHTHRWTRSCSARSARAGPEPRRARRGGRAAADELRAVAREPRPRARAPARRRRARRGARRRVPAVGARPAHARGAGARRRAVDKPEVGLEPTAYSLQGNCSTS